jgi:NTP pyrophosphatase (non-canonical NTP hydrolase)
MDDSDTTLEDLKRAVREFRDRRDWEQFHTPKNLSMAIAIEAAELMEEFLWLKSDEARGQTDAAGGVASIAEELADVLIYALSFANAVELDVTSAVVDKLAKNAEKYPEAKCRGLSSWLDSAKGEKS